MEGRSWERMWPPELPYDYSAMNLDKASLLIDGAKKKAEELGFAMTMAVCDAAGNLVSLQRMDDAALLSLEIAQNKARTAVFGKIPTLLWGNSFKGTDPELLPLYFHSGWITFMGGFPVVDKKQGHRWARVLWSDMGGWCHRPGCLEGPWRRHFRSGCVPEGDRSAGGQVVKGVSPCHLSVDGLTKF